MADPAVRRGSYQCVAAAEREPIYDGLLTLVADGHPRPVNRPEPIPNFGAARHYAGPAVVSGDPFTLHTTVFDNVSITCFAAEEFR